MNALNSSPYILRAVALKFAHKFMKEAGEAAGLQRGQLWADCQKRGWAKARALRAAAVAMESGVIALTFEKQGKKGEAPEVVTRYATAVPALMPEKEAAYFVGGCGWTKKTVLFWQLEDRDNSGGLRSFIPFTFLRWEVADVATEGNAVTEAEPTDEAIYEAAEGLTAKWETLRFNEKNALPKWQKMGLGSW